jgi:predicted Rossmann-fold nucleotide-binding protein
MQADRKPTPMPAPHPSKHGVQCVVSGGQTGVDRAALDAALELGLRHGGWCPRGRVAEDGVIPSHYDLQELDLADYAERTRRNVQDSDATLILLQGELQGGTLLTWRHCQRLQRPVLIVRLHRPGPDERVREWLVNNRVEMLNVAGPRASKQPKVYEAARTYLIRILRRDL